MTAIRPPAVAGLFYPGDAPSLARSVRGYLQAAPARALLPKALILPHAGYVYSGPVAGAGYRLLLGHGERFTRVVLLGPAHHVPVDGIAVPAAEAFETPLGSVPVDVGTTRSLLDLPGVCQSDEAHAPEHSLEVHLPFLQQALPSFSLVPLVAGDAAAEEVAGVLEAAWGGPETLVVVSSDLSHYRDYETARRLDLETARAIEDLRPDGLGGRRACGAAGIRGLLLVARAQGLRPVRLELGSSGDTAGDRDRVVGYGAWAFVPAPAA